MELLDLPLELLRIIIKESIMTADVASGARLREVHGLFAEIIEQDFVQNSRLKVPKSRPLNYGEAQPREAELYATIRDDLLAPRGTPISAIASCLRPTVAFLMQTPELLFPDTDASTAVTSHGSIEEHHDPSTHQRFTRIVDLLTRTVIYSEGLAEVARLLKDHRRPDWFWRSTSDPLEWAVAVAVFNEDLTLTRTLVPTWARIGLDEGPQLSQELVVKDEDMGETFWYGRSYMSNVLCLAMRKSNYDIVSFLLENKADVNGDRPKPPYETPLSTACQRGSLDLIQLLLKPCWELSKQSTSYCEAIPCAARCIVHHGEHRECDERNAIIDLLMKHFRPSEVEKVGVSALSEACTWGCKDIAVRTLDALAIATANAQSTYKYTSTAIKHAAAHGHVELLEYLLQRANSLRVPRLFFPINRVRFSEAAAHSEMVAHLIKHKATIMQFGPLDPIRADFILHVAAKKNCAKTMCFLMGIGFDIRARSQSVDVKSIALFSSLAEVTRTREVSR
ncbi:MAG: hypothetical protein Q9227_003352 [Pyrenula ochraceoflavens]